MTRFASPLAEPIRPRNPLPAPAAPQYQFRVFVRGKTPRDVCGHDVAAETEAAAREHLARRGYRGKINGVQLIGRIGAGKAAV